MKFVAPGKYTLLTVANHTEWWDVKNKVIYRFLGGYWYRLRPISNTQRYLLLDKISRIMGLNKD